ncbi:saccharopine dehydrogenase family protein [Sinorhizobium fredii]|uniref:saccharopine dehydrogenase family protein n=1 Tax=Rhizobium fredii TaxID=380 RepID=UPI0005647F6D|nr:saccharopine dehydrogenase NADP-binding domain-containing protein [Sinorhizobium fredii]MCG5475529.1 saccharopine dehydrogenase NADP-binding domain-containing protein [Sinorhizobium fredii]WOS62414.1 saccharopine dehydrogenase NADP-binding domain-containing protein [Sinorhizobium fredii GR64]
MKLSKQQNGNVAIAVYGASGHTGKFVLSELARRGLKAVAVGRSAAKLVQTGIQAAEIREASIEDANSLDRAFSGVAAVINCAGPFLDTADPVAAAALRAGAHYLDVTAEQGSALSTYETFDNDARQAGLVFIPAMGFYGGFADLLVSALLGDWVAVDDIRIGIALDSWHPTIGSRNTGKRNTARRLVVANGQLSPIPMPAAVQEWKFLQPFGPQQVIEQPFSEISVVNRHLRSIEVHTYLNETGHRDVHDPNTPPPVPADETGLSAQRFMVEVVVRKGNEARHISAFGRDIYAFTAPLVCEAVQQLLAGKARVHGAQAPGAVFDALEFLDALAPDHLSFETLGV